MSNTDQNPPADDDLSADDLAAIEAMRDATPDQTGNADQSEPPASDPAKKDDDAGKPDPKAKAADDDDDEDPDELTIDTNGKAHDPTGKFVPKSAYLRIKEARKADRVASAALQERLTRGEARMETLIEIINSAPDDAGSSDAKGGKAAAEPNPWDEANIDKVTKPIEAIEQLERRMAFDRKERIALQEKLDSSNTTNTAHRNEMAIVDAYKRDSLRFYGQNPEFKDAWAHLTSMWHKQLETMGIDDKAQRDKTIGETERGIVHAAFAKKGSPAEAIWKLALASGYTEKPKDEGGEENNGKPQASEASKRINSANKAMNANKSLSGAGGGAMPANSAILRMGDMSDEEFCAFADTVEGRSALRKAGLIQD